MENKPNKLFTNPVFVVLAALLCCALWGSASPAITIGTKLVSFDGGKLDTASTILFAGLRFMFAGVLTIIIYSIARRKVLIPQKQNWGKVLCISSFQTILQYIFFYIGLANSTSVKGAVISGCNAFCSILVASLLFRQEKLTVKKIVACIIGFAGIIIINLKEGLDLSVSFFGEGFVFFSTVCVGMSSTLIKIFSKDEDPVVISGYQFAIGGLIMAVGAYALGGRINLTSAGAIGILTYLAFLSAHRICNLYPLCLVRFIGGGKRLHSRNEEYRYACYVLHRNKPRLTKAVVNSRRTNCGRSSTVYSDVRGKRARGENYFDVALTQRVFYKNILNAFLKRDAKKVGGAVKRSVSYTCLALYLVKERFVLVKAASHICRSAVNRNYHNFSSDAFF